MIRFYNDRRIVNIGYNWENKTILSERISILRSVIMAHNLGMYNVSIPAILAQLEGTIIDAFQINSRVKGNHLKVLIKHLLLDNNNFIGSFNFDDAIEKYYSENILMSFSHGSELGSDLSRHAILHGGDKYYGKEIVSIKAILLFDYIVEAIDDLKESTISHAKLEIRRINRNGHRGNRRR
jgi:hypothetical protein